MVDVAHLFRRVPRSAEGLPASSSLLVRSGAWSVLCGVVVAVSWGSHATWRAMTDSFVAPMSLSPDSAAVSENKVRLTELELERARGVAEAEAATAELSEAEAELAGLVEFKGTLTAAQPWAGELHTAEASAGEAELNNLSNRQWLLSRMIAKQREIARIGRRNLEAGVIKRSDYEQEELKLDQLTLSALETSRARAQSEFNTRKIRLGQKSLAGGAPPMPETVAREDLRVRLETQILHVEARLRARKAEESALLARVQKLDELVAQLKRRPLFQATERQLDVAFVPYTQLRGVVAGAQVIQCSRVVFGCHPVGTISEVIPGEVVQQDPWGNMERGQYAALSLTDRRAVWARTLRVRGPR